MNRGYQNNYSTLKPTMFDTEARRRKAATMVKVLSECAQRDIASLSLLNVGGSAGIIDEYLSHHFKQVVGMDIDEKAIAHATANFARDNLVFEVSDAMNMPHADNTFDVVVCSQVYEHVPDAARLMLEIHRVLRPDGLVYFAASNRLVFNEPHYNLPLLSVIPRPLAHLYMRLTGKGTYYYEKHLSYWGLRKLARRFEIIDYTGTIIQDPIRYRVDYLIRPGSRKQRIGLFMTRHMIWLVPGYIWVLRKNRSALAAA